MGLGAAVREGLTTLKDTIGQVRRYKNIAYYLITRMIYTDGLNTLYAFGGIYAGTVFGMDMGQLQLQGWQRCADASVTARGERLGLA